MKRHSKIAFAALTALAATGCSASPPGTENGSAPSPARAADAPPPLYGRWRIVEVNGRPARSIGSEAGHEPGVAFGPSSYGGSSGCNSFGGTGLLVGARWFADSPMATQQGCGDLTAQEDAVMGILAGGPAVQFDGDDVAVLRTAKGILRLRRVGPPDGGQAAAPPVLMAGTRWTFATADGAPLSRTAQDRQARLTLEADEWTLEAPCATRTGQWRQEEGAIVLEPGRETARACRPELAGPSAALTRTMEGRLHYAIGPNEEIVLANADRWAAGGGDRAFSRGEPDPLVGQWRVLSVAGVPPPPSERPAELGFGGGSFAVWDGCRHSEGVAITHARQLFTFGSGVVTLANCPRDEVRARLNAIVGSSPRVARTSDGGLALVSRAGSLRLARKAARSFGTGVERKLRGGIKLDLATGTAGSRRFEGRPARFALESADRFTLALACGTIQGRWRNVRWPGGWYARFSPERVPDACAADPLARRLERFFSGNLLAAIGPNQDIALLVSESESLPGRVVRE